MLLAFSRCKQQNCNFSIVVKYNENYKMSKYKSKHTVVAKWWLLNKWNRKIKKCLPQFYVNYDHVWLACKRGCSYEALVVHANMHACLPDEHAVHLRIIHWRESVILTDTLTLETSLIYWSSMLHLQKTHTQSVTKIAIKGNMFQMTRGQKRRGLCLSIKRSAAISIQSCCFKILNMLRSCLKT